MDNNKDIWALKTHFEISTSLVLVWRMMIDNVKLNRAVRHILIQKQDSKVHVNSLWDLDIIGQQILQLERLAHRDVSIQNVLLPALFPHPVTELPAESAHVAEETGTEETVT